MRYQWASNISHPNEGYCVTNLLSVDWSKLPAPEDDGLADHLMGVAIPSLPLVSTAGGVVDLGRLPGKTVIYAYPMTGQPDVPLPDGWDMIPGARGCTPQSCAFRDHFGELRVLGVDHLFGLSTQETGYQAEAAARLHLPFPLLSDAQMTFAKALELPSFDTAGMTLLKRLTMVINDGRIVKVFYPVFPPDRSASDVLIWLRDPR
ncbi:MAG: peroxiredoxin [Dongiaceae bacterium]